MLLILCLSVEVLAAGPARKDKKSEIVYGISASLPKKFRHAVFEGGDVHTFSMWVGKNVQYPQEALNAFIEGRVMVAFVVERDGTIGDIQVIESPHSMLDKEVVRILGEAPPWSPATVKNKPVRMRYVIPVTFRLEQ